MPLRRGRGRATIGQNTATEEAAGKPPKQAEAIALNTARDSGANIPAPRNAKIGPKRRPLPFGSAGRPGGF